MGNWIGLLGRRGGGRMKLHKSTIQFGQKAIDVCRTVINDAACNQHQTIVSLYNLILNKRC
jgi:hypothetical protein